MRRPLLPWSSAPHEPGAVEPWGAPVHLSGVFPGLRGRAPEDGWMETAHWGHFARLPTTPAPPVFRSVRRPPSALSRGEGSPEKLASRWARVFSATTPHFLDGLQEGKWGPPNSEGTEEGSERRGRGPVGFVRSLFVCFEKFRGIGT